MPGGGAAGGIFFHYKGRKYYSEIKVNGEPGGEDLFVWEKGKGLVEFGTGFGSGPLDVHIDEICEVTESD